MAAKAWFYFFSFSALATAVVWLGVFTAPADNLQIIACDVGQGDAILLQEGATQILVDGGPNNDVIRCLGRYMPFWDRRLEAVVMTHADADHATGLIEVFRRYEVNSFIANEFKHGTQVFSLLLDEVQKEEVEVINPMAGMSMLIGLMHLDIVWPLPEHDRFAANVLAAQDPPTSPNDLSAVFVLRYGDFDALLTGDIGPKTANKLAISGAIGDVEYLKVPHHGSKNGLTLDLLDKAMPEVAVISAGRRNRFGHPHGEIIKMLENGKVRILRTDEAGDVVVASDGNRLWVE